MINRASVCAVIVTYNRLAFLKECIISVLNQTSAPDKIIIVNNGSTDGTNEYLQQLNFAQIEVINQDNIGGAGGFNTGIGKAYEQDYEWIWVMDDDVEPFNDCLEQLLKYTELSKCIHPLRVFKDNNEVFKWEHYFDYRTCMPILLNNASLKHKDYCFVNTACFEGMLINRSIVKEIGLPRKEYFIAGDDTEYGVMANFYTNIIYTKTAQMYRKRVEVSSKMRPLQAYYEYRNLFLLRKTLKPYFPGGFSSLFYKNLFKDFYKRIKIVIKGKEYTFKEKRTLILRMFSGIKDGFKMYKKK
ncbi:glycosyltransferase family 2 protein [Pedobacter sp. UBA5917]|jgi:GT2 family glycosyltransferase|uniref:glycosyltransferase family 2 protein n=1 Tax=Pedobacter sp. UBA5917 TaxID=1947061 RepID=UPI0025CD3EA1|nr:glycosyltransferase family 2 protein [Pedobacter sp. UBA5917]